jgi:hypothetical protein
VFPEAIVESPPLIPEEIDEEATVEVSIEEVTIDIEATTRIEHVTVEEHFLRVEYVPARLPERRGDDDESAAA